MRLVSCVECGEHRVHKARGLCRPCYSLHLKLGTHATFALTARHGPTGAREAGTVGLVAVIDGVSYRQLDFWVRRGYLKPHNATPGSGYSREWTTDEAAVATTMGRLVIAGFTPELAHRVARARQARLELAPGVFVEVA